METLVQGPPVDSLWAPPYLGDTASEANCFLLVPSADATSAASTGGGTPKIGNTDDTHFFQLDRFLLLWLPLLLLRPFARVSG